MRSAVRASPLFLVLLSFALDARATGDLRGRVVAVKDGDTVGVLVAGREMRVRLAEVDAPEKAQPYGAAAKKALSDLVFDRDVRLEIEATDRYGRLVARIFVEGLDVNRELVRGGHVWVYRQYLRRPELLQIETEARATRRGLWALQDDQRAPPWEWRRRRRVASDSP